MTMPVLPVHVRSGSRLWRREAPFSVVARDLRRGFCLRDRYRPFPVGSFSHAAGRMTQLLDITTSPAVLIAPGRDRRLDALRGLAIAAMMVDHVALFLDVPVLRMTVGRVAMPIFFVLGGHLATRISYRRWAEVAAVGVVLQFLAPWSGAGPLLLCFVVGAALVVICRPHPRLLVLVAGLGLLLGANGFAHLYAGSYDPRLLLALMAFGALLPRDLLRPAWLDRLRHLEVAGRRPLQFYAGHVLLLAALAA